MNDGKLVVNKDGSVLLDGKKINRCTGLTIRLEPTGSMEAEIHVAVDEIDVEYGHIRQMELQP